MGREKSIVIFLQGVITVMLMLFSVLDKQKEEKVSSVEGRMVSIQHAALSKRFQTAMADYQGALAHHKDQTEARIKAQLRIGRENAVCSKGKLLQLFKGNKKIDI